jgi:hypothetical protein
VTQRCQDVQVRMLIESGLTFGGLEGLLDGPPPAGDADEFTQRHRLRTVAPVERQLTGGIVAAHQDPLLPGLVRGQRQVRPGVHALALGPRTGGQSLPRHGLQSARDAVSADGTTVGGNAMVARHRHHISDPAVPQSRSQRRVVAVHLVTGHP